MSTAWIWAFALKNLIPQILLILFINLCQSENDAGDPLFGNYEGYINWPFQVVGILCVAFAGCLILVGLAMPVLYEPYDIPYKKKLAAAAALEPQKGDEEEPAVKDGSASGEDKEEVAVEEEEA